jgi:IclR family transcriptional regulator, acetate operon repressor
VITLGANPVPVKRSQSASRTLAVLEAIAAQQPITISSIARLLDEDRSAIQRSVMTLSDLGWIRNSSEPPTRWELSAHLFAISHLPYSSSDLRERARPLLEDLRNQTGETAFLAIPDVNRFIVIEVAESRHALRMASRIGEVIPPRGSATGRAVLPWLELSRQTRMLGRPPDEAERAEFALTQERGFSLSVGDVLQGATNLASPVFDASGQAMGAIVISGPSERLAAARHEGFGRLLARAARQLSRRNPIAGGQPAIAARP